MPFCPACGSSVNGRFCPQCGAAAGVAAGSGLGARPVAAVGAGGAIGAAPAANAGLTENAAGALCYLGGLITGIVFLAIAPYNQNPRIRFHAFQSILFHVSWVLSWFAMIPLHMLLPFGLSLLLSLFSLLLWGGGLLLWLALMWKAYQGQALSIPLIGAIARRQAGN